MIFSYSIITFTYRLCDPKKTIRHKITEYNKLALECLSEFSICYIFPSCINLYNFGLNEVIVELFINYFCDSFWEFDLNIRFLIEAWLNDRLRVYDYIFYTVKSVADIDFFDLFDK